jgi:hypothetical protein
MECILPQVLSPDFLLICLLESLILRQNIEFLALRTCFANSGQVIYVYDFIIRNLVGSHSFEAVSWLLTKNTAEAAKTVTFCQKWKKSLSSIYLDLLTRKKEAF